MKREPINIDNFGKLPPQVIDIEKDVLGALLLEKKAINYVSTILVPESFYKTEHQYIYTAIIDLFNESQPIDYHTVIEKVKSKGQLFDPVYIIGLTEGIGTAAHVNYHAQLVAEKYMLRSLIAMANEIQKKSFEDDEDISDILSFANSELVKIQSTITNGEIKNMGQAVTEAMQYNLNRGDRIKTHSPLDEFLYITDTDYILIAARPGHGKTALALQLSMKMSEKTNGLYISLEMSTNRIVNRILSNEGEIDHSLFFLKIDDGDKKRIDDTAHKVVNKYNIYFEDQTYDIEKIRAKIQIAVLKFKIGFVVIDYLQLIHAAGFGSKDNSRVSYISRVLKQMTLEYKIPFFVLSQLNREVERGTFRKPKLSDLRDSGAIEQDADSVIFLTNYKAANHLIDEKGNYIPENLICLDIAKHRNGSLVNDIGMYFEGKYQKFYGDSNFSDVKDIEF